MGRVHLTGQFGTVRQQIDADFPYFGETIRIHPDASDLYAVELMTVAQSIELGEIDFDNPSSWTAEQGKAIQDAMTASLNALKGQIHPDDWDRFLKVAKANRQQTLDLMALSEKLTEAVAGFPTGPSSESSTGRRNTKRKSGGGSSSPDTSRALTLLQGRPDLQAAVVQAQGARAG